MKKRIRYHFTIGLLLFCFVFLFQNCKFRQSVEKDDLSGTTVDNPFNSKVVALKFDQYSSGIQNAEMCLTNILLRFDASAVPENLIDIKKAQITVGGFNLSYFYNQGSENKYYINGLLDKKLKLNSVGTTVGEFNLPVINYDKVIFGFTPCHESGVSFPSLQFSNKAGEFADSMQNYFALQYDGARAIHNKNGNIFAINFLTDSLAQVVSFSDLLDVLKPYRNFDLIGFNSFKITNHSEVQMRKLAFQSDGKAIALGSARSTSYSYSGVILTRYLQNGFIDHSFGNTSLPGLTSVLASIRGGGLAVSSDDSIFVVAGSSSATDIAVLKLDKNGKPVSSFGENGWVTISIPGGEEYGHDIIITNDDKILVAGISTEYELILAKLNQNGTFDNSFGNSGIIKFSYKPADYFDKISLKTQGDNKILVSTTYNGTTTSFFDGINLVLMRFNENGTLDTQFNSNSSKPGLLIVNFGYYTKTQANDLCLQPDGKIIVVGRMSDYDETYKDFIVMRANSNGTLDTSFANQGRFIYNYADDNAESCLLDQNKIIVGGTTKLNNKFNFMIFWLNSMGVLEATVNDSGLRLYTINEGAQGKDLILRPDGNYYFGGSDPYSFNLLTISK